jgi:hypothetical protein
VDNEAITLSDLDQEYKKTAKLSPDISRIEVLNTLINRKLLLKEANKYRIEAPTQREIIDEYIDLKIRAFIRIYETDLEEFYKKNSDRFSGNKFDDVRKEIEVYLTEKEVNERLKEELNELRKKSYIKIQLSPEQDSIEE